jgi:Holliday junction resolvase RusA-like endonuclease
MKRERERKHHNDKVSYKKQSQLALEQKRAEQKLSIKHALDSKFELERTQKRQSFAGAVAELVRRDGVDVAQKSIALHLHLNA